MKATFDLTLTLTDINKKPYTIFIPGKELMIEPEELGLDDGHCYVTVFYELANSTTSVPDSSDLWTIGSRYLQDDYFVFDQTPFNERADNYNYVGIGKKNPDNIIGQQHYDPSSENYAPEDEQLDQSFDEDGFQDPYKSFAFWLRDNKGLVIFMVFLFVFVLCCVAYIVRVQCKKKQSYTFRLYSENLNKSGIQ